MPARITNPVGNLTGPQGFPALYAVGGNTGSGLGSLLQGLLFVDYGKKSTIGS